MADLLADAFAALPGVLRLEQPAPVDAVDSAGRDGDIEHGRHLHLTVRPTAPIQLLFTGHMDTVFGPDHAFQETRWLEDGVLNGPGVADMKGGLAVMLAALKAVERSQARRPLRLRSRDQQRRGSRLARVRAAARASGAGQARGADLRARRPARRNARRARGRAAAISRSLSTAAPLMPDAIPRTGATRLLAAADLALRLAALRRDGLSVNPSRIEGGSPSNVVPDLAVLRVNMRPRTPEIEADAKRAIDEALAAVAAAA